MIFESTYFRTRHYFQRPDAPHLEVDSNATSLSGFGGTAEIGKYNGNWRFESGITWRSPGLELNDVGFMPNTDYITHYTWAGFRKLQPFSIFRELSANYNHWVTWKTDGTNTYRGFNVNTRGTFKNFWGAATGMDYEPYVISDKALFGGPLLRRPQSISNWIYLFTDSRKKLRFDLDIFNQWSLQDQVVRERFVGVGMVWQPINALTLSLNLGFTVFDNKLQNVTTFDLPSGTRYVAGTVEQQTFRAAFRLNYSITPDLTIQYFGQPFASRVRFKEFKYISDPLAERLANQIVDYEEEVIQFDEKEEEFSVIEEDGETYTFDDPDFSRVDFRSNMVVRWEYVPGSELFLVWAQGNSVSSNPRSSIGRLLRNDLFSSEIRNTFLIKWTYRFLL